MYTTEETFEYKLEVAQQKDDYPTILSLLNEVLSDRPPALSYDQHLLFYYLQTAGYAAQKCEQFVLAKRYHEEAVFLARSLLRRRRGTVKLARALHYLGDTHIQREENEVAAVYLKESAFWLQAENNINEASHVNCDVGMLAYRRGDFEEAQKYLHRSLSQAREIDSLNKQIWALKWLTFLAFDQKAIDAAEGYYTETKRLISETF